MTAFFRRVRRKITSLVTGRSGNRTDPAEALRRTFPDYEFGRGTYGDLAVREWGEGATLKIGKFCSIATGVQIFLGGEHRPDWVTTYPFNALWPEARKHSGHPKTKGDVIIGSDVWIGTEAVIMSGLTIGNGAVVGARAVVTRSVPPYAIAAGNPAQVVRLRFSETTITRLEAIRWWDWSTEEILRAMPDLLAGHLSEFLDRAESGQYTAGARYPL